MMRSFGVVLGLGLGLFALGCGGDKKAEDVPPAGPKYPDLHSFCAAVAGAECTKPLADYCQVDQSTCVATVQDACMSGKGDVTAGLNTNAYNPAKAEDCVGAVTAEYTPQSGAVVIAADAHVAVKEKCDPVFSNLLSKGLSCKTDNDCDPSLFCYFQPSATPVQGVCQPPTPVGAGQDCSPPGSQCPKGMHCVTQATVCGTIKKAAGDSCWEGDPCPDGLFCDLSQGPGDGSGVCATPRPHTGCMRGMDGDPCACTDDVQCDTKFCSQIGMARECFTSISIGTASPFCPNFGGS